MASEELCEFLDLVDVQSEHQHLLHEHLAKAFLALAREGYRDPSSAIRLANLSPLKADTVLSKDGKLVFSAGREQSPLAPVPSSELREAIVSFRAALQCAVDVVQAREKVNTALDVAEKESNEVCSREDSNAEETELDSAEKEAYGEADCGNTDEKDAEKDAE